MPQKELLKELKKILDDLGIELRHESGDFSGGLLRIRGKVVLIVNPELSVEGQIQLFCRALASQDLRHFFILPAVRREIESVRS